MDMSNFRFCIAVKKTFPVILLLLHQISLETKSEKQMEAKSLLFYINFEFISYLYLFCDTFSEIKIVSDYLQKPDSDLSSSCLLVESLINYLMDLRNTPNKFEDLLKEVELCAQKNNIQLSNEKVKETRFRKLRKQFSSYLTEVATAENRKISISSLNPKSDSFLNLLNIKPLAEPVVCSGILNGGGSTFFNIIF
ncbi:hypothetical protein QTP88_024518 [Uroleucon formosanum]